MKGNFWILVIPSELWLEADGCSTAPIHVLGFDKLDEPFKLILFEVSSAWHCCLLRKTVIIPDTVNVSFFLMSKCQGSGLTSVQAYYLQVRGGGGGGIGFRLFVLWYTHKSCLDDPQGPSRPNNSMGLWFQREKQKKTNKKKTLSTYIPSHEMLTLYGIFRKLG